MEKIYSFLQLLKQNNNREWFNSNKHLYLAAKAEFEELVKELISRISEFQPQIAGLSPAETIFRIYRDTRFSKDKRPYKEFFGAFIAPRGKKSPFAGYYLHLEPGNTFVGGGVYCPKSQILNPIRWYIYENPEHFLQIITDAEFVSTFGGIYGEQLKTYPRGFPKDFAYKDLLKYKSYAIMSKLPDKPGLDLLINTFQKMKPFNDFLNEAIMLSMED